MMWREKTKDTIGIIRSRKAIKDGLYNSQKRKDKRTHDDLQYTETKDWATRIPLTKMLLLRTRKSHLIG